MECPIQLLTDNDYSDYAYKEYFNGLNYAMIIVIEDNILETTFFYT